MIYSTEVKKVTPKKMNFDTLALETEFCTKQFELQSGTKMTVTAVVSGKFNQNEFDSGMLSFYTFSL